jgi:hypothetical protein
MEWINWMLPRVASGNVMEVLRGSPTGDVTCESLELVGRLAENVCSEVEPLVEGIQILADGGQFP